MQVLPWLLPTKRNPRGVLNCDDCREATGLETRRAMHCGWLDERDWTAGVSIPPLGQPPYAGPVCPGWLVRTSAVVEASAAVAALKGGTLALHDPDGINAVYEVAVLGMAALNVWEAEQLKQSSTG